MNVKTSVKKVRRLKDVVRDIYSQARIYHLTHDRLLDLTSDKLWNDPDYEAVPRWAQAQVDGFYDGLRDGLYRYELTWYVRLDGELIDGDDVPTGQWHRVETGAFVWKDNGSIFFERKEEA